MITTLITKILNLGSLKKKIPLYKIRVLYKILKRGTLTIWKSLQIHTHGSDCYPNMRRLEGLRSGQHLATAVEGDYAPTSQCQAINMQCWLDDDERTVPGLISGQAACQRLVAVDGGSILPAADGFQTAGEGGGVPPEKHGWLVSCNAATSTEGTVADEWVLIWFYPSEEHLKTHCSEHVCTAGSSWAPVHAVEGVLEVPRKLGRIERHNSACHPPGLEEWSRGVLSRKKSRWKQ